jgi:peptide/nickel transport system substrate-binding protein
MTLSTRRHGMRRTAISLVSVSVLLGAACATAAHAGTTHAAPAYGGTITLRAGDSADCLDPQLTASATANTIDAYIFETLLSIDTKGHYVGDLASKYKSSKGGTVLTFTLKKGVKFSNGDPLTAKDVKYTFDRALNPATKSPVSSGQLPGVTSTKVVNTYTVQLNLKAPSRPILTNLAGAYLGILDAKWFKAHAGNTCTAPVGSGPYKVKSTSADFSEVTLTANKLHNVAPSWVKNKGVPYVTTVRFATVTSDTTAMSELLSTGVDIATVPGTQFTRVKGQKGIVLHKLKSQTVQFIEFNTATPPFNSLAMRKAFVQLIDRSAIVKAAYSGQASAIYGPMSPGMPYYDKAAKKDMPAYDPAAAKAAIAAAHATGPYTYLTVGTPALSTQAEVLQQSAATAGMTLNIVTKSGVGDFVSDAAKGNFDIASLLVTYPDPDVLYLLLDTSQGGGAGLNWTGNTNNPALDSLLEKGRTTLSSKKIGPIYDQAQVLINKQLNFIGVVAPNSILAVRSNIKGYHVDSVGSYAEQDLYIKTK